MQGKPCNQFAVSLNHGINHFYAQPLVHRTLKKKHILLYMFKLPVVKLNLNTGTDVLSVRKDA